MPSFYCAQTAHTVMPVPCGPLACQPWTWDEFAAGQRAIGRRQLPCVIPAEKRGVHLDHELGQPLASAAMAFSRGWLSRAIGRR
jgi:hypothetical protein